ncbi:unnamed protein product [Thelazia callipaeda]|uniref:Histone acetyltransferase n=1 Tax=Thelazia callipaeda TaxID=103827 RepID=A0A0N5CS08_THECL|nr:unnamed protein product [Thelazia callipaeda]
MTVDKAVERQWIQFGSSRVLASYRSAYPEHLTKMNTLYLCEFCLMGFADEVSYTIHKNLCSWYNPPGNEIYRDGVLSFWEVDGNKDIGYCRRVCLLSKLFLAAKFIHYDVEPFIFYILTEHSRSGYVFVGYFSKEKDPDTANNLSCLFTFPTSRQLGYGKLLIDLSYKLSVREKKVGGPEHPLSDLGLITYQSYWKAVIISYFRKKKPVNTVCIKDISCETGLQTSDIIYTMLQNKMIRYVNGCHLFSMVCPSLS